MNLDIDDHVCFFVSKRVYIIYIGSAPHIFNHISLGEEKYIALV